MKNAKIYQVVHNFGGPQYVCGPRRPPRGKVLGSQRRLGGSLRGRRADVRAGGRISPSKRPIYPYIVVYIVIYFFKYIYIYIYICIYLYIYLYIYIYIYTHTYTTHHRLYTSHAKDARSAEIRLE